MKQQEPEMDYRRNKRVVFLNPENLEPELLALSVADASRYLHIGQNIVTDLCMNRIEKVPKKSREKIGYKIMYADQWEKEHNELLPYGRVNLE